MSWNRTRWQWRLTICFGVLCVVVGVRFIAEPPNAKSAAIVSGAESAQARVRQLLPLRKMWRERYQNNAARIAHLRSQLIATGYAEPGHVSSLDVDLTDTIHGLTRARQQHRASVATLEAVRAALSKGQDPAEVIDAARAEPRVRYIEQRLEEAEINLAVAARRNGEPVHPASTQPSDPNASKAWALIGSALEIERDVLAHRAVEARSDAAAKARLAVVEDLSRRELAARKEIEGLQARLEQLKEDIAEATNQAAGLALAEREQEHNMTHLRTIQDEIDTLQATMPVAP